MRLYSEFREGTVHKKTVAELGGWRRVSDVMQRKSPNQSQGTEVGASSGRAIQAKPQPGTFKPQPRTLRGGLGLSLSGRRI